MGGDGRLFIKVHNGFPEHPKTGALSDRAFRNLIELWCYCSRNLTDGKVSNAHANKILSPKSRRELAAAGYLIEHPAHVEMHDYLVHQQSAQQVADLRERRAEAGRRGGKAKANRLASAKAKAKQTPSKPVADTDTDTDQQTTSVGPRKRATQLPPDWEPNFNHSAIVKERGIDGPAELTKFRDWAQATGKTYKDWDAAFRNWLRNAKQSTRTNGAPRNQGPDLDAAMRRAAARDAERTPHELT